MFPSFAQRTTAPERMDDPACDRAMLLRTVDQFAAINRLVSRYRTILSRHVLNDMAREPAREHHLVDLGAGGCDIPRWLLGEAKRRRLRLRVTAGDSDPRIVAHARARNAGVKGLDVVRMDALDPEALRPCDYVFANHVLHHLDDGAIQHLLRLWLPATRRAMILSDLLRHPLPYFGFSLLGLLFRRSFARADGLLSIRKGFRPIELRLLAAQLPAEARVLTLHPGRVVLVLTRDRSDSPG